MTFSLVARCADTGMFGVAIASSSPAVAARCSYARAGVGAVASQNVTDPTLGPLALDLMEAGASAEAAIEEVRRRGRFIDYRQVLAVDRAGKDGDPFGAQRARGLGRSAWAGCRLGGQPSLRCRGAAGDRRGVPGAEGHLGDRLVAAMRAGLAAGGEAGPVHSAGLKLVDRVSWPVADLRCDWTEACPIEAVATAWEIYKPQVEAYVQRALDPRQAPSYGVPGDR